MWIREDTIDGPNESDFDERVFRIVGGESEGFAKAAVGGWKESEREIDQLPGFDGEGVFGDRKKTADGKAWGDREILHSPEVGDLKRELIRAGGAAE